MLHGRSVRVTYPSNLPFHFRCQANLARRDLGTRLRLTASMWAPTLEPVKDAASVRSPPLGTDGPPSKSRVDRAAEEAALACVRRGRRDEALKLLMTIYGSPITGFILRIVRNRATADDLRQQVFLDAFHGIEKFQERSSLWSWLCRIAYHRCVDELRHTRRERVVDGFNVLDGLVGQSDTMMDTDRGAKRRALEQCLGKLPALVRSQLLMRYFFGLSYMEIGEAIGAPPGTVQVRMSRILPQLRRCLHGEGITR